LAPAAVVGVAPEELDAPVAAELDEEDDAVDELDLDELEQAAASRLTTSSGPANVKAFIGRIMGGNLLVARGHDVMSPLRSTPIHRYRGKLKVEAVASMDRI
jgi:hypothetical protein